MIILSSRFSSITFEIRSSRPDSMIIELNDCKLHFQTVVSPTGTYDVLLDMVRTYSDAEILLLPSFYSAFSVKGTVKGKCVVPFCNPVSPVSYSPMSFSVPMVPGRCQCAICVAIGHCVTNTDECKILRAVCSMFGDRSYCDGDVFSGDDPLAAVFYFLEDSHMSFKGIIILHAVKDFFLYRSYVGDPVIGCMMEDTWHEMLVAQATLKQVGELKEVIVDGKGYSPDTDNIKVLIKLSETHPVSTPFFRKFISPRVHLLSVKRDEKFLRLYGRKCFSHFALTVPKSDLLTEYMTLLMFLEAEAKQLAFDRGPSFFSDVKCECGRRLYYYKKRCVAPCNQCCFKLGRLEVFLTSDQIEADYRLDSKEYAIRQLPFRKMRKRSFPRCLSCGHLFRFTDPELSLCSNCIESRGISLPFVKDKGITDTISCSICHKMYDVEFLFNIETGNGPGFQCIRCSGKDKIVTYTPPPVPLIFSGDVEENPGPFFLSFCL